MHKKHFTTFPRGQVPPPPLTLLPMPAGAHERVFDFPPDNSRCAVILGKLFTSVSLSVKKQCNLVLASSHQQSYPDVVYCNCCPTVLL